MAYDPAVGLMAEERIDRRGTPVKGYASFASGDAGRLDGLVIDLQAIGSPVPIQVYITVLCVQGQQTGGRVDSSAGPGLRVFLH